MSDKPVVVVAVVIGKTIKKGFYSPNVYLIGRRKGGVLDGKWCFPGGKVKNGESLASACVREVLEETGILLVDAPEFWTFTESFDPADGGHMIGMVYKSWCSAGTEAKLKEPDKFYEWQWFEWDEIPKQSMTIINQLVSSGRRLSQP